MRRRVAQGTNQSRGRSRVLALSHARARLRNRVRVQPRNRVRVRFLPRGRRRQLPPRRSRASSIASADAAASGLRNRGSEPPMQAIAHVVSLTSPLFLLAGLGYVLVRWFALAEERLRRADAIRLRCVPVPALLFRLMSDFSALPPVDARLLIAYFGGCFAVFVLGRAIASRVFRMDGGEQSVFAVGGIFAERTRCSAFRSRRSRWATRRSPVVSLVLVFNSMVLWTLVTVSVEWARTRHASLAGFAETAKNVVTNPVVASILAGTAWGGHGLAAARGRRPHARAPRPGCGAALADRARDGTRRIRRARGMAAKRRDLGAEARRAAARPCLRSPAGSASRRWRRRRSCSLSAMPVGANVYLMAREFDALPGPIAASLVISTVLASLTTPVVLMLVTGA